MEHTDRGGRARRPRLGWLILAGAWCLLSAASVAQDFDFYAMDLIGQESYRKISMDLRDASLKDVLKIFSEQSGLNFIAAESIEDRTMTLFLDSVPLNDALKKIMQANNLTYEMEPGSNVFIVKETGRSSLDLETRVYPLRYARLKASNLETRIAEGGASDVLSLTGAGGGGSSGGASEGGGGEAGGEKTNIEDSIKSVMTDKGKLVADVRTNTLIVTDVPAQFPYIERVIRLLDTAIPQVVIEVEMLDVSKRTVDQLGVDTTANLLKLTGSSKTTRFPNFMADGLPQDGETFSYGTLSASVFQAVLDYLRSETTTKFLARPKIMTLSGETAEIKIATNEVIGVITTTDDHGNITVSPERYVTGVSLKVTPQADTETGEVTMFVEPRVVEAKASNFEGGTFKDPEVRSSITTLMVKERETIVVGGLIRNRKEETVKKMPIVGDLPLVGMLFRHKDSSDEERELLVFLTPRIVGFDNVTALARGAIPVAPRLFQPFREQPTSLGRKEEVDSYLERWEN
ncbi:MAG: secretin N-terminal domain-containing protein [Deltaproteobacteria bacterium]